MALKWVFITGATSGIGRACAEHLASRGFGVVATGRNPEALRELAERSRATGWRLEPFALDVTSSEQVAGAAAAALELSGGVGIDVLVNNAGIGQAGFLADLSAEKLRAQFEVSLFGLHAVTRALLSQLAARGGTVINIGSIMGRMTVPWMGAYGAVKAAVRSLTETLRVELGSLGVRVVLVEPGAVETAFHRRAIDGSVQKVPDGSPYAGTYAWLAENDYRPFFLMPAVSPLAIARLVERIVERRRPRARYVLPFGAHALLLLMRLTPRVLMDPLKRRVFHIPRISLQAPRLDRQ